MLVTAAESLLRRRNGECHMAEQVLMHQWSAPVPGSNPVSDWLVTPVMAFREVDIQTNTSAFGIGHRKRRLA